MGSGRNLPDAYDIIYFAGGWGAAFDLGQSGAPFEGEHHPARDIFANHYVADGDLITGQNQNAGPMVARLMMQRVLAKRSAHVVAG